MAKKVQMSTVEMVWQRLEEKGWTVEDCELSNGVITIMATADGMKPIEEYIKQPQALKWLESVQDVTPIQAEAELSIEEWEAQYGHLSDEDVAQALAPMIEPEQVRDDLNREIAADNLEDYHNQPIVVEEVEPVAEAAPETHEGETNMETKVEEAGCKLCGELYPVGDLTDGVCPPCIIEAHRENAEPEDVSEALAHEDNLYSQYLSVRTEYFDENPDLGMVFEAMTFRRFLVVRYQTDYANGTSVIRERKLLPSHVYQAKSTEGICVVAYDTYRKEIRTFRLDKFRACRLGEIAPEPTGDAVTIYPAAYEVRRAVPQRVKNPANYIASGKWSSKPLPQVLMQ